MTARKKIKEIKDVDIYVKLVLWRCLGCLGLINGNMVWYVWIWFFILIFCNFVEGMIRIKNSKYVIGIGKEWK